MTLRPVPDTEFAPVEDNSDLVLEPVPTGFPRALCVLASVALPTLAAASCLQDQWQAEFETELL